MTFCNAVSGAHPDCMACNILRSVMIPSGCPSLSVTTMEEIPVLSDQERAKLTTSLKEAEARVKAGKAIDYDPKTFKDRLIGIYRGSKR